MKSSQLTLLLDWMRKVHKLEWAHRYESITWKHINLSMGIVSVTMATVISAMPSIPGIEDSSEKLITSVGAIIVAILTGLLTFLKPSEHSEALRMKADQFEALRHELEEIVEFQDVKTGSDELSEKLSSFRESWKQIDSLNVSDRNFDRAGETVNRSCRYPRLTEFRANDDGESNPQSN